MNYIQYAVLRRETGNASGKAKNDASDIAFQLGFLPSYKPIKIQFFRVLQQIFTLWKFCGKKVIFVQYPAVSGQLLELFHRIISSDTMIIALIHDLRSIQGVSNADMIGEKKYLSYFDYLIVHNKYMERYIKKIGYKGNIICLELFDYLHDLNKPISESVFSKSIAFAGNLSKAPFLRKLNVVENCNFLLYGNGNVVDYDGMKNIQYKGVLPSDKIQYLLEGDYGLVWDGDSIRTCSGMQGEYLRYNNPHKLSLYIAAGKPVITWKKAAIADFILENEIGIVVDSLEELNYIDLEHNYYKMRENVLSIKKKVATGDYLKHALKKCLNEIEGKNE